MTPEEKHADAVKAAHEWRDDERERRVWVDSGSGPGYEVLAPRSRQRGEMPSDREGLR